MMATPTDAQISLGTPPRPRDPPPLPGILTITGFGFVYRRNARAYRFFPDHRNRNSRIFDVEADVGGRKFFGTGDISIAAWRREFASQIAGGGNVELERQVRTDLNCARFRIQQELIPLELGELPPDEPIKVDEVLLREIERLPAPKERSVDLVLFAVPESVADEIAEQATVAGATVKVRGTR